MDFLRDDLASLAARVRSREVAAREMVQHALDRIERLDGAVNAFVALDGARALAAAAAIDERLAAGDEVGPLAGIPIGVKDLEDAAGFVTTFGSASHVDDAPADADSILVARLKAAGCVVVGKTNTPEFGCKGDTVSPTFGATRNPWDLSRSPGGSSGGSAAAVAAGMVPLATGSDGGGSIRIPSALCGLSGMKPSLGRVPSGGPRPAHWAHLSSKGVMARRLHDVVYGLDLVVGPHPSDLRALPMPEGSWTRSLEDLHPPARVVWSPTLGYAHVDDEVLAVCEAAVRALAARGTEVIVVDDVFDADPVMDWLRMTAIYSLRMLEHLRATPTWERLDPYLVQIMEWMESSTTAVDLARAEDACHRLNLRLVEVFHQAPLLLTPTVAGQTPASDGQGTVNGVETPSWVGFTYPFNMTRSPAGSVCAGFTADGMPVGLQVVGPQHGDVVVLRALAVLEETLGVDRLPSLA